MCGKFQNATVVKFSTGLKVAYQFIRLLIAYPNVLIELLFFLEIDSGSIEDGISPDYLDLFFKSIHNIIEK